MQRCPCALLSISWRQYIAFTRQVYSSVPLLGGDVDIEPPNGNEVAPVLSVRPEFASLLGLSDDDATLELPSKSSLMSSYTDEPLFRVERRLKRGRWTPEDDQRLVFGWKLFGNDIDHIKTLLLPRLTTEDINHRMEYMILSMGQRDRWSVDELARLMKIIVESKNYVHAEANALKEFGDRYPTNKIRGKLDTLIWRIKSGENHESVVANYGMRRPNSYAELGLSKSDMEIISRNALYGSEPSYGERMDNLIRSIDPLVFRQKWKRLTKEEVKALLRSYRLNGRTERSWRNIYKLFPNRSRVSILYHLHSNLPRLTKQFIPEEDETATLSNNSKSVKGPKKSSKTKKLTASFPLEHPVVGISKVKMNRWTPEEDKLLEDLVDKHGTKFAYIAKMHFPTRTRHQVWTRWDKVITRRTSRKPWTEEEKETIRIAHQKHGNKWLTIRDEYFPDRHPHDLLWIRKRIEWDPIQTRMMTHVEALETLKGIRNGERWMKISERVRRRPDFLFHRARSLIKAGCDLMKDDIQELAERFSQERDRRKYYDDIFRLISAYQKRPWSLDANQKNRIKAYEKKFGSYVDLKEVDADLLTRCALVGYFMKRTATKGVAAYWGPQSEETKHLRKVIDEYPSNGW
ncbi:hypothetical protein BJ742DRAFT_799144 [Cladochytrium replicatum]|nr:hypothetical protein BJ742DRAFT_799144 [Cladochytrium replicatum]